MIHAVLPRKIVFSRKVAGHTSDEQVVAANIDTVFIVTGLDENFSVMRIESYLVPAWESRAVPVVLLNKSDICRDAESKKAEIGFATLGIDVVLPSAKRRRGH